MTYKNDSIFNDTPGNVFGSPYEKLFSISSYHYIKNIEALYIPTKECKYEQVSYFSGDNKNFLKNIDNYMCFEHIEELLSGKASDQESEYIDISIKINKTHYFANKEKVQKMFDEMSFKFTFHNSDRKLNFKNGTTGDFISREINSHYYTYLDVSYNQFNDLYLQIIGLNEDYNLFYKSLKNNYIIKYSYSSLSRKPFYDRWRALEQGNKNNY